MEIEHLTGDATRPQVGGRRVIAHVCNDIGAWGKGFVLALSDRWPITKQRYLEWFDRRNGNDFRLGAVQFVEVDADTSVANMVAQSGIRPSADGPPIRYTALRTCLRRVAEKAQLWGASVHMPRIGTGLAGGTWDQVRPIIEQELLDRGIRVYVYTPASA